MAQRNPRRGTPTRATAKSKKTVVTEAVAVEDAPGIGVDAGLAIFTTVAAFNVVGERVREALDPRSD